MRIDDGFDKGRSGVHQGRLKDFGTPRRVVDGKTLDAEAASDRGEVDWLQFSGVFGIA